MTSTCPAGHPSESVDYCDQCGRKMPELAVADPSSAEPSTADTGGITDRALAEEPDIEVPDAAVEGEPCPACGNPHPGTDRYCEACGYDFAADGRGDSDPLASLRQSPGEQGVPNRWEATVVADRAHYERVGTKDAAFPPHCPERRFLLEGAQVRIGRRSASRGVYPEIDLSGAPVDVAISHLQAVLIRQPGGTFDLIDPGSMNGTTLNDNAAPIAVDEPVHVNDGDEIHIGAWTTITVHACAWSEHGEPTTPETDEPVEGETRL
jgi:FHA domain-containing protein